MKISHYYPHSGGILGCHANVDFQHTNYLLNVTIGEKLRCAHKLQTISDAFSHIASRFVKVALAIKFALNWLAGPQCCGAPNKPVLPLAGLWCPRSQGGGGVMTHVTPLYPPLAASIYISRWLLLIVVIFTRRALVEDHTYSDVITPKQCR